MRVELNLPAGGAPWLLDARELQLSSRSEVGREERCFLQLNKTECTDLGFGHFFDGKAASTRYLKLYVQVGVTGAIGEEVPLTENMHGTSRKAGWEGATLRLVLLRVAPAEKGAKEGAAGGGGGGGGAARK